jgi:hypothetical protein
MLKAEMLKCPRCNDHRLNECSIAGVFAMKCHKCKAVFVITDDCIEHVQDKECPSCDMDFLMFSTKVKGLMNAAKAMLVIRRAIGKEVPTIAYEFLESALNEVDEEWRRFNTGTLVYSSKLEAN